MLPAESIASTFSKINYSAVLLVLASAFYWAYVFVTFYHLVRFGVGTRPKIFALIFLAGSAVFFAVTMFFYHRANIQQTYDRLETAPFLDLPI